MALGRIVYSSAARHRWVEDPCAAPLTVFTFSFYTFSSTHVNENVFILYTSYFVNYHRSISTLGTIFENAFYKIIWLLDKVIAISELPD